MAARFSIRVVLCCALLLGLGAPGVAWENDSEQPGSVLVFHKFVFNETDLKISVTCPQQLRDNGGCAQSGQAVKIMLHWVCPGERNDNGENVCREFDFTLNTTVNGTLEFDTAGEVEPGDAGFVPRPPCVRGYLIAWVVNDFNQPIKFDGLIGNAVIEEGNGLGSLTSSRSYNALPIQAAEWLYTGDTTDQDGDQALDFDGNEYRAITGKIYGSGVEYEDSLTRTDLTLLTLDVRSNLPNEETFVGLEFFNENEQLFSTHTSFTCWQEVRVSDLGPDRTFGENGSVESTGAVQGDQPVTLIGILETVETVNLPVPVAGFVQPVILNLPAVIVVPNPIPGFPPVIVPVPTPPGCQRISSTQVRCFATVAPFTVNFPAVRDHAYSLFHDGRPVPTTFVPSIRVIPD